MDYKQVNDYEVIYMIKENDEEARNLLIRKYKPIINKVSSDYELPIYYLNVGSLATEDYNSVYASSPAVNKSGTGYISTPTTLLVSKGEEIDYIEGLGYFLEIESDTKENLNKYIKIFNLTEKQINEFENIAYVDMIRNLNNK